MGRCRSLIAGLCIGGVLIAGCTTPQEPTSDVVVGVAYDVGGRGDGSFNSAAAAGLDRAVLGLGVSTVERAAEPGEAPSAKTQRLRDLAGQVGDLVVAIGSDYADQVQAVAAEFPDTVFAVVDGVAEGGNVASLLFAEEEGSFLVGTIAAQARPTQPFGFLGGADNEIVRRFEAGYEAGVRAVLPQARVDARFLAGDGSGFTDTAGARDAAAAMFDAGVGIIYHAAGAAGAGVFEAARDAGALAIGVDSDQYLGAPDDLKPVILTSMLKRVDLAVYQMVESVVDAEPLSGVQTLDLASDGVGYATSNPAVTRYVAVAEDYRGRIASGSITVPTTPSP